MQALGDYKYFGLLAFVTLIIGLSFIVYKWPQSKRLTFSQHVAAHRHAVFYYIALFSIVIPLLLFFFLGWFVPTFNLSVWFSVFLVVSSTMQYACTLIPEVGGWKTRVHRHLSGASGICLIPPLFILLFASTMTLANKGFVLGGLVMIATAMYLVMSNKKDRYEPTYIHQSLYYAGFFLPILIISYL